MDKRIINIISNYFKDKPVKKVFLFGSQIKGESSKDSDIDILVELDYTKPIGLKFVLMKIELEELLKRKVDLLTTNSISKYILPYVEREKRLIYER